MITNGIQVDPESGRGYNLLPVSPEWRTLIRQFHLSADKFVLRYGDALTPVERRSSAAGRTRSADRFYRPDDLARDKLRLRISLLQRVSG